MLVMISVTLAITEIQKEPHVNPDCIKLHPYQQMYQINHSLCDFIKQIEIPNTYNVTLCLYQDEINIDISQFVNGKVTVKEMHMNIQQWTYIQQIMSYINKTFDEVKNP